MSSNTDGQEQDILRIERRRRRRVARMRDPKWLERDRRRRETQAYLDSTCSKRELRARWLKKPIEPYTITANAILTYGLFRGGLV